MMMVILLSNTWDSHKFHQDFPGGSDGKASAYNAGDLGSIPGSGRCSGEGNGNPLLVLLPGKSHGWRSVVGYSPWGCKESDTTEQFHFLSLQVLDAAAAAKSLQSCPTLCDPHRQQPTRLHHPWDSPGKNTGVGCHFLLQCMKVKSESEIVQSCLTLCDPMDCSPPGSSVLGFSRQEYWNGLPLLSPKFQMRKVLFLSSFYRYGNWGIIGSEIGPSSSKWCKFLSKLEKKINHKEILNIREHFSLHIFLIHVTGM